MRIVIWNCHGDSGLLWGLFLVIFQLSFWLGGGWESAEKICGLHVILWDLVRITGHDSSMFGHPDQKTRDLQLFQSSSHALHGHPRRHLRPVGGLRVVGQPVVPPEERGQVDAAEGARRWGNYAVRGTLRGQPAQGHPTSAWAAWAGGHGHRHRPGGHLHWPAR
eukprot:6097738-Lingulodinium_polyedra.AAC.1